MGLTGLVATGVCSMMGASIYVVPFMIHRSVPGIDAYVLPAWLFAVLPALLAALAYASLASAMPRAGGSYIYASRALNPYLGFVASFSQWFGLCMAIGVVSYVIVPFLRDMFATAGMAEWAAALDTGSLRLVLSLAFLWVFVWINLRGISLYERTLIPLMGLMFALGSVVIIAGLLFDHKDFGEALMASEGTAPSVTKSSPFNLQTFFAAGAILFTSFIGFDSIAQAGGEARNPTKLLPRAIILAVLIVMTFDFLFTASVYHAIPWSFVADKAASQDITAPGLLSYLLSPFWAAAIIAGAAVALINDLPAMILSVSRMMFAWAEDGIFPRAVAQVSESHHTPTTAIVLSGTMASLGILGCHFAGDFFLGIDILVTSMLVNFLLMCVTLLLIPSGNPTLAGAIVVIRERRWQLVIAIGGILLLGSFLLVHTLKDLQSEMSWYMKSTFIWLFVMIIATLIYLKEYRQLKQSGADLKQLFKTLPPE